MIQYTRSDDKSYQYDVLKKHTIHMYGVILGSMENIQFADSPLFKVSRQDRTNMFEIVSLTVRFETLFVIGKDNFFREYHESD